MIKMKVMQNEGEVMDIMAILALQFVVYLLSMVCIVEAI